MKLMVNGAEVSVTSDPETPLVYVLRNELGLKGAKIGCGLEQCGACAVLVDGQPVLTCATPAAAFEGREIVTVEGLSDTPAGARVQAAFVAEAAAQCGYCTPGLVVAVTALVQRADKPDRAAIRAALAPHLCRCGSHTRVLRAAEAAIGAGGP